MTKGPTTMAAGPFGVYFYCSELREIVGQLFRVVPSLVAEEDEGHADGAEQDSEPALAADSLIQKGQPAEGSGDVAQGGHRDNEADVVHGECAQKSEESRRHHAHADPHPREAQGS